VIFANDRLISTLIITILPAGIVIALVLVRARAVRQWGITAKWAPNLGWGYEFRAADDSWHWRWGYTTEKQARAAGAKQRRDYEGRKPLTTTTRGGDA
jgi:hypothetical protein